MPGLPAAPALDADALEPLWILISTITRPF
jgi:hypothetical protein